jgi:hypothetical protein
MIVPDINPLPSAVSGVVQEDVDEGAALKGVKPGHLVMGRSNSALVKFAFALLNQGRPSKIIGEDVLREMLEETLDRFSGKSNKDLLSVLIEEEKKHIGRLFSAGHEREVPFVKEMYGCIHSLAKAKMNDTVDTLMKVFPFVFFFLASF